MAPPTAPHPWQGAIDEWQRQVLPRLRQTGKAIGALAKAGNNHARTVVRCYEMLRIRFDPGTLVVLQAALRWCEEALAAGTNRRVERLTALELEALCTRRDAGEVVLVTLHFDKPAGLWVVDYYPGTALFRPELEAPAPDPAAAQPALPGVFGRRAIQRHLQKGT